MSKNYRVLLTDDDQGIHDVLRMAFQDIFDTSDSVKSTKENLLSQLLGAQKTDKLNIELIHTYQGDEALSRLKEQDDPVDLIVLDMLMPPGVNGVEVLKQLVDISKNFKIVISTAYFHDLEADIRELSQNFEEVYLLHKPYDLDTFSKLVKNIFFDKHYELSQDDIIKLK